MAKLSDSGFSAVVETELKKRGKEPAGPPCTEKGELVVFLPNGKTMSFERYFRQWIAVNIDRN